MFAGRAAGQTFTNLYNFSGLISSTNGDGANSIAGLVLSGTTLYGVAQNGGSVGKGTIFAVNIDGTGFTNLHSFTNGGDGAYPSASLVLSGSTLYGTTQSGGTADRGTVFSIETNGTGFSILYSFVTGINNGGSGPYGGLILSGDTLYGTAFSGGSSGVGTVFALNTNGTAFTNLHSFDGSNGASPSASLVLSENTLYGTTYQGGSSNVGTIFAVNTDGTGFTNLHNFIRSGGANPYAGLILSGDTLYGCTRYGGDSNIGTIFAIGTNSTGFATLLSFTGTNGANPNANLTLLDNTLYGTTFRGGNSNNGSAFAFNLDSAVITNFYSFTAANPAPPFNNNDGANPVCQLVLSGNTVYGTTSAGGSSGVGTIFKLSVPPPSPHLMINLAGANVLLTWTTNAAGFTLQFTTNLVSPIVWDTNLPAPVIVNGQNTVTNPISGTPQFFQLSQ